MYQPEQLEDIAKHYLFDHPEKRHLPASDLVTVALNEKFPCR
ncbi:MAG: Rap1a/Tai family immunity protein [Methyloceanibacter sp.]